MDVTSTNEKTNEIIPVENGYSGEAVSIIEYAETEMATFFQKKFSVVDSLVLSQMAYMNFGSIVPGVDCENRAVAVSGLYKAEYFEGYVADTMMPKKNRQLLNALCASPRFRDVKINYYTESTDDVDEKQFCAMTFFLPTGETYVAYRGTDTTINGWKEDFNLFFLDTIPGQISAAGYLETVAGRTEGPLYVGGHSKGGNLAMYAASFVKKNIQDRIIKVFNHDGPGLTPGAIAKPEYSDMTEKMNITLPHSSVIGLIFCQGNYSVVSSGRIGILQHDPFSWEIIKGSFVYEKEVKPGANKLIDAVYELMDKLDGKDRELFIDTVFEIIYSAGATTFSDFPAMAIRSRDNIMATMRNIEPETADKVKSVIAELIKTVAKKAFTLPDNESSRLTEALNRISDATDRISERVTVATDKITDTRDRITERITESAVKINETTGRITEKIEKAKQILKKDLS
ncbi:MAG: DUF2974 domain-containing protein, partial [Oscillospiraceae bacterium]|nr:DUF2974 domain-containing protein [Oscillospiraceae bacterium]